MSDSGIVPVRTIATAVLAATVPTSVGPVEPFVPVYVVMRTKNVVAVAFDGLTTPLNTTVTVVPLLIDAAVLVIYVVLAVLLPNEKPVCDELVKVAPVETPVVAADVVQVPLAVVQY